LAGVVFQAVRGYKNPPKPNRDKKNKVEPQPSTSSDSSSGPPPNGQLQNQEPISGTDSNVYCLSYALNKQKTMEQLFQNLNVPIVYHMIFDK
jgi:cell envelope opacity-associated protein A